MDKFFVYLLSENDKSAFRENLPEQFRFQGAKFR